MKMMINGTELANVFKVLDYIEGYTDDGDAIYQEWEDRTY